MSFLRTATIGLLVFLIVCLIATQTVAMVLSRQFVLAERQRKHERITAELITQQTVTGDAEAFVRLLQQRAQAESWSWLSIKRPNESENFSKGSAVELCPVPAWFCLVVPLNSTPPQTQIGPLNVQFNTDVGPSYRLLWSIMLGLMLTFLSIAPLVLLAARRFILWGFRPINGVYEQIEGLGSKRFIHANEPVVSEWRGLVSMLNMTITRVRAVLDEKESNLLNIQDELERDPLTKLSTRRIFMNQLQQELSTERVGQIGGAVVFVRVHDLMGMNQYSGRERADDFLQAVAMILRTQLYAQDEKDIALGRLNGSDFALLLPGVNEPELAVWLEGVSHKLTRLYDEQVADSPHVAWLGATLYRTNEALSEVLPRVDAMLMRCENRQEKFAITTPERPLFTMAVAEWRVLLENTLEIGGYYLDGYKVVDAESQLLHTEMMLRMRDPKGNVIPAADFIPPAIRTGRIIDIDIVALEKVFERLSAEPGDCAVNFSIHSIKRPVFHRRLELLLQQAVESTTRRLWIEVDELGVLQALHDLKRLADTVRPFGCKVGIDHFGRNFSVLPQLKASMVDYVKLDSSFSKGIHEQPTQKAFIQLAMNLAKSLNVMVIAEGVANQQDLDCLRQLGVAGFTGPAVS